MVIIPSMYINRELSWLAFNTRVLDQAKRDLALLERLKFIAIYATNLDEFYMIRVAGLKQLYQAGISLVSPDEMQPAKQLECIREYLHNEQNELNATFCDIKNNLASKDVFISSYDEVSPCMQEKCKAYFDDYIFSLLVPIAVDSVHPFPHLVNLSNTLALRFITAKKEDKFALVKIPALLPKFFKCNKHFILVSSIIKAFASTLFPGLSPKAMAYFRITRNADLIIAREEADDFMALLEQGLRLRRRAGIVRLQLEKNCDLALASFLHSNLLIPACDTYEYENDYSYFWELITHKDLSHLLGKRYYPKSKLKGVKSVYKLCDKEDILIYQPFESFDIVERFITDACDDECVISIRMSLYRVEKNSKLVLALIKAANQGKQVTVMVELRARFDEENNLAWAKSLEKAGAHVIYGISGHKAHAKLAQIIRQNEGKLDIYNHISTGNYNASSAAIYTDVSFFTKDLLISKDTTDFFHILSGYSKIKALASLFMSPRQIKGKLLQMIHDESMQGKNGQIIAKMNALVDPDIINALYKASIKGVSIDLIIRGACCLRPGMEYSQNIRVISIVGKYLEHARIFYFKSTKPNYFFSSADWMNRNLMQRFELMCAITQNPLRKKLKFILNTQLQDNVLAYKLLSNGKYERVEKGDYNSQEMLEKYTSKLYKQGET